jgi:hypothetical protein
MAICTQRLKVGHVVIAPIRISMVNLELRSMLRQEAAATTAVGQMNAVAVSDDASVDVSPDN